MLRKAGSPGTKGAQVVVTTINMDPSTKLESFSGPHEAVRLSSLVPNPFGVLQLATPTLAVLLSYLKRILSSCNPILHHRPVSKRQATEDCKRRNLTTLAAYSISLMLGLNSGLKIVVKKGQKDQDQIREVAIFLVHASKAAIDLALDILLFCALEYFTIFLAVHASI